MNLNRQRLVRDLAESRGIPVSIAEHVVAKAEAGNLAPLRRLGIQMDSAADVLVMIDRQVGGYFSEWLKTVEARQIARTN